ncbi:uncharacterized protein LOC116211210 isoform X2 [Punica granatum]|uniref:Uncharacterized protein LOC116211210 isoform X2 n=1 Tax=Punica granatum TaxID=22663 RepID=A0A6P8E0Z3_PUNGR|nr:uncharacterized protein LOC116211210 isoform X2 [Punica granatum]
MMEQAREELQKLESQHPKRFATLKMELKSFISLLESNSSGRLCYTDGSVSSLPPCSTATTQASTCRKRKVVGFREPNNKAAEMEMEMEEEDADTTFMNKKKRRDSVETVLERARLCLRKIRELKTSFS